MSASMKHSPGEQAQIARAYFDTLTVKFQMIDSARASTETEFLGETLRTPIMTAALSRLGQVCPNGPVLAAQGALDAGSVMWAGIGSEEELESMASTGSKVVKIVKPYEDEALIYRKLEHAEKAGMLAVGMDIDFFFGPKRSRGYALGHPVSPKTSRQLACYVKAVNLPFIFKGVLSAQDALRSLEAGAAAIVVSNHGGAVSDFSAAPLKVLPQIKEVVGGSIPIVVDGAVESGMDAFKALALGADAVCTGKPIISGLGDGGRDGVAKVLNDFTEELKWAMSVTGAAGIPHIGPDAIVY
ncbi:MAG: alpha-hydroxy-acid oxidizing protein [Clostridiales Family XIII bacterium]|jgi:isopentenyl diphosphate isomerase/L-lactate dehydrogenase-like FMN-dependent dehydrogenase|nr:alpha-hydroxy-acid oxidizing protein [Clostridiales Family XIII bacterium]